MQKQRKKSDLTVNSPPMSEYYDDCYATQPKNRKTKVDSVRSSLTGKSKYSSSSKLTKSHLFNALSKKGNSERKNQLHKEQETEIQILKGTLQVLQKNEQNLLYRLGQLLNASANQADQLLQKLT